MAGTGTGTKDDPWRLTTAPGSSHYEMYRDEAAHPPTLVCQVGSTRLLYLLRAIDDLHAWLEERGDWVDLGAADEKEGAGAGDRRGVGEVCGQPGRWLVWAARGPPRTSRDVLAAASRRAGACRAHARATGRPGPRDLQEPSGQPDRHALTPGHRRQLWVTGPRTSEGRPGSPRDGLGRCVDTAQVRPSSMGELIVVSSVSSPASIACSFDFAIAMARTSSPKRGLASTSAME